VPADLGRGPGERRGRASPIPQRALVGVQLQETGLPQRLKVREAIRAVAGLYADPGPVDEISPSSTTGAWSSRGR